MHKNEVAIKIGGQAGFGIKVAGQMLGHALFKHGFFVFGYTEYPSLIRGGHNVYQLNVATDKIYSPTNKIHILICLNQQSLDLHQGELAIQAIVIHNNLDLSAIQNSDIFEINIDLDKLSEKAGSTLTRNVVALGAVGYLIGFNEDLLDKQLEKSFADKGNQVVEMNKKAFRLGYNFTAKQYQGKRFELFSESRQWPEQSFLMTANETTAHGIIQAGCKFYAAYPMTPATSILHILAQKQRKTSMVVHQTEDEISAIGSAIGASFAGLRAATGTSGGGFALMNESLGLAGITETPLVVIESQRTAPATGLPTWTEQADLQYAIHASHGEFPRFVISPGDAEEAFYMIGDAFNLAEKFQVPVIFLLDKHLSESDFINTDLNKSKISIQREGVAGGDELRGEGDYKRYQINPSGISKRALPGHAGGVHIANSDDHDEYGFSTEDAQIRVAMMDKRFSKVKEMLADIPEPILYGPKSAKLTIVGWGSTKRVVLDAIRELELSGKSRDVNFLYFSYIWPFHKIRVSKIFENQYNILLVENNKMAQLGALIKEQTGVEVKNKLLKYDGRPFFREEIVKEIRRYV